MPLTSRVSGAGSPPLTITSSNDVIKAYFNASLPGGVTYVEYEFYPDWESAGFYPEDITWTKTAGSDALFTFNPAGVPITKPGGFILRAARTAVGGAGTSAVVTGLTSSGRTVSLQLNMAQFFNQSIPTPPPPEVLIGQEIEMKFRCNYGAGFIRTAELFEDTGGGFLLVDVKEGTSTDQTAILWEATFKRTILKSASYYVRFTDGFGRMVATVTVSTAVVSPRRTWVEYNGIELYPGANVNSASGRFSGREVKQYEFVVQTNPPSTANPSFGLRYSVDSYFNNTRCRLIPNAADDHRFIIEYPSNAVAGAGDVTIWVGDVRYLVEWSAVVPARPAMVEFGIGTLPSGLTCVRTDATNWAVGLTAGGGAKDLNVLSVPTGSSMASVSRPYSGDLSVVSVTINNNVSWRITPVKAGKSKVTMQTINYSGDPEVIVNLNITVT